MLQLPPTPDPEPDQTVCRFALSLFSCARTPGLVVPYGTFKRDVPMRYLSCELRSRPARSPLQKSREQHRKKARRVRA
jgi:hypothetical protein